MDCQTATKKYDRLTAEFIAADLNARLKRAAATGDFYSDKIFDIGRVERGSSFPQPRKANEGGIFWHRYQETTQPELNLGFKQYTGHSHDPALQRVRMRQPNYVQVDINRYGGGRGVYHDTPIIKPEFFTEVVKVDTPVARMGAKQLAKLRVASVGASLKDAFLGWTWRMEIIKRQVAGNVALQQKLSDINTQISELSKSKDPEAKLEIAELKSQRTRMTGAGFYEWLRGESDIALLKELIMSRRYTVKVTELGQKWTPEIQAEVLQIIRSVIDGIRRQDAETLKKYGIMSKKQGEQLIRLLESADNRKAWGALSRRLERATLERLMAKDRLMYLDRIEFSTRYASYMDKAARLLGAYRADDVRRLDEREAVDYLAYVGAPAYYSRVHYEMTGRPAPGYRPVDYRAEPMLSLARIEYPIVPTDRVGYPPPKPYEPALPTLYKPPLPPKPYEPPTPPEPYVPPTPYVPPDVPPYAPIPPYAPPPKPPPKPPLPPPVLLRVAAAVERQAIPSGSIAWRQGIFWKYIPPPFDMSKPITLGRGVAPIGATRTGRTPAETVQMIGDPGADVPESVTVDLGVVDIKILNSGRSIQFKGKGEQTNVGTRIDSPTKGMSILGADTGLPVVEDEIVSPTKEVPTEEVPTPEISISRADMSTEAPDRTLSGVELGEDSDAFNRRPGLPLEDYDYNPRSKTRPLFRKKAPSRKTRRDNDFYPTLGGMRL